MPANEHWTIGRLLEWTTEYLKGRGADSPRLDAEVLLAEARRCARIELYTAFHEPADEPLRLAFRELVRRRAAGEPVAYLVGRREFYSLSFQVTPDVLVPRPETELVVVTALDLLKQGGGAARPWQLADVGTGSGVIAVCLAKHAGDCHILATDVSEAALAVAADNARRHGVSDKIAFAPCDLLTAAPPQQRFHLIASNPPYVSDAEWAQVAPDVKDHEPRLALAAGPTGAEVIQRLIPQAAERLAAGGWLVTEISPMLESRVRGLVAADGRFQPPQTVKDLAGLARVITARRTAEASSPDVGPDRTLGRSAAREE